MSSVGRRRFWRNSAKRSRAPLASSPGDCAKHRSNTERRPMKLPFEADFQEILAAPERFVDAVFSSLASEFLVLPKGDGFVEYPDFEAGYEALKRATDGFA